MTAKRYWLIISDEHYSGKTLNQSFNVTFMSPSLELSVTHRAGNGLSNEMVSLGFVEHTSYFAGATTFAAFVVEERVIDNFDLNLWNKIPGVKLKDGTVAFVPVWAWREPPAGVTRHSGFTQSNSPAPGYSIDRTSQSDYWAFGFFSVRMSLPSSAGAFGAKGGDLSPDQRLVSAELLEPPTALLLGHHSAWYVDVDHVPSYAPPPISLPPEPSVPVAPSLPPEATVAYVDLEEVLTRLHSIDTMLRSLAGVLNTLQTNSASLTERVVWLQNGYSVINSNVMAVGDAMVDRVPSTAVRRTELASVALSAFLLK